MIQVKSSMIGWLESRVLELKSDFSQAVDKDHWQVFLNICCTTLYTQSLVLFGGFGVV